MPREKGSLSLSVMDFGAGPANTSLGPFILPVQLDSNHLRSFFEVAQTNGKISIMIPIRTAGEKRNSGGQEPKSIPSHEIPKGIDLQEFPKRRRIIFFFSLPLILLGLALIMEGLDLASGSGLLFGSYVCFAGLGCGSVYNSLEGIFLQGLYLLCTGLAFELAGIILLTRAAKLTRRGLREKILTRSERRFTFSGFVAVLFLLIFFLAAVIPFQKSFAEQPGQVFPRVDVCYQNSSVVNSAVFEYQGTESLSYLLFGRGNFLYWNCLVVSGPPSG